MTMSSLEEELQAKYFTEQLILTGICEITITDITAGRFSIVFGSPELLVGNTKRRDAPNRCVGRAFNCLFVLVGLKF